MNVFSKCIEMYREFPEFAADHTKQEVNNFTKLEERPAGFDIIPLCGAHLGALKMH